MANYRRPGWFDLKLQNPAIAALTRAGISVWGSRLLRVRGRTSGEWRTAPVNVLTFEGQRYLVAPRGQTQWVRNLRVAGSGELLLGKRAEPFKAFEIGEIERVPILRAYLKRWKFEVGRFFRGVSADSPQAELMRIAPDHPVFRVEPATPAQ
jgi:F420H(2)-dependent quinone reductase